MFRSDAQTQIDVINDDYAGTNADQALWAGASGFYPGLNPGSVDVEFCIATVNHPAGGDPEVLEGNPLVTIGANGSNFGANFPEQDATYAGYMNFIIKDIGSGLLGYSPLNGSIANGAAVVMNTICYGTGSGCAGYTPSGTYNLGRTVTHELGHFYNLNHTFIADSQAAGYVYNCAPADGDSLADTPKVSGSTYGTPANGSVDGCVAGEKALTMNYMDYVNDASMYMFTPDQATRVEAYFASVSGDWKANVITCNVPSGPEISFANGGQTINETTSCVYTDVTIDVNIGEAPSATANVTISTSGAATNNVDYQIIGGNLTFPMGSSASQSFILRIYNDGFVETNETLTLDMVVNANGGNAVITTIPNFQQNTITIISDNVVPNALTMNTIFSLDNPDNTSGLGAINADGNSTWGFYNSGINVAGVIEPNFLGSRAVTADGTTDDYIITPEFTIPAGVTSLSLEHALVSANGSQNYELYFTTNTANTAGVQAGTLLSSGAATAYTGASTTLEVINLDAFIVGIAGQTGSLVLRHTEAANNNGYLFWDTITLTAATVTAVQTTVNVVVQTPLVSTGVIYTSDTTSGDVMADINNTNNVDYGCVDVNVSRASGTAQMYQVAGAANFVMDKTFAITPVIAQATGNATLKFYFTAAEIQAWVTATGNVIADLRIIKDNGSTQEYATATVGTFGSEVTLEGTFTTGIKGTYYFGKETALTIADNEFSLFNVYPNPSNGNVNITLSSNEDVQVSLFDIRGRQVYAKKHNNNSVTFNKTIDFSAVAAGVYLLNVESGAKKATKKLVIQ